MAGSYSAKDISVLEGLEPVRKRPGMYIGTTGTDGLHHLIWEIFDNSRDEAMGGHANHIEVALLDDDRIRVVDNGRGIPVDKHPHTKVSALDTIMTTLHAGGKFGGEGYKVSGGLHGVGASVVNALSTTLKVYVHRDGAIHHQEYEIGKKKFDVKKVGKTEHTGTIVEFRPDISIFKDTTYDWDRVVNHLRQQAYLVKGLRITCVDARSSKNLKIEPEVVYLSDDQPQLPTFTFFFEGGLKSLVTFYNHLQKPIHLSVFYVEKEHNDVAVEVALQYNDDIPSRVVAFANNIHNPEGGTHITGFKTALTRTINTYARSANLLKGDDDNFTGDDVLEGLTAVVSVKMREIQFEGQTKAKLGSTEATGATATVFAEGFAEFLEEHPDEAKAIVNKVILALKARKAAKAAKDSVLRKGALEGMTLPGKLADCQSKSAEESEIFIVEGDSAGGTAKTGRDRRTQAILPLRGKILNVERARLDKMLSSEQIKNLVIALGTAIGDTFDISKLRYHKVIIATDADVDGSHIVTLILTLLYRHFRPLLDAGHIYIAQPPLYKVKHGKDIHYFYNDAQKNKFLSEIGFDSSDMVEEAPVEGEEEAVEGADDETPAKGKKKAAPVKRPYIQRYKGLGEMNAEELWETTMDPARRVLKRVDIDDAEQANEIFDMLMGTDVPARKSFIQSNAKLANLDV
jgi:DNA gyrase subunit B